MIQVTLPYPPSALLPNNRKHWTAHGRAMKAYRKQCGLELMAVGVRKMPHSLIHLDITFCPPDYRPRDLDNMLASFKAGIDSIATAIGIDDQFFEITHRKSGRTLRGAVIVKIIPLSEKATA